MVYMKMLLQLVMKSVTWKRGDPTSLPNLKDKIAD